MMATSSYCQLHESQEACVSSQINKLRIAIALLVIRDKPAGQTAKDFARSLRSFHQNREQRWKAEYRRLKQEVLILRQQKLLSRIDQEESVFDTSPCNQSGPSVASQQGEVASFLTPPDSQLLSTYQRNCMVMSISSIPNGDDEDAMGIKFLRAYFFLEHQLRRRSSVASAGTFVLENDVVRQSVGAILGYVERSLRCNPTDFHHCLESLRLCVKLLDHHSTSDVQKQWFTAVRDAFVRTSTKCLQSFEHGGMQKPFALLQILAGSTTLAPQLAESLLKLLSESLLILMDWDLSQLLPESILDVLSRVSYYVLLIEKALPRLSPGNRKRLIHLYPDVHPTIRVHFPLLASSLIRLQAQLA